MANVKATVLKPFTYKGKLLSKDEEVSLPAHAARTYANIDFIKLDKAAEEKVEKVAEAPSKAAKK